MKIDGYKPPKSSFLSVEKDLEIIVDKISKNKRIQRLLYYTTPDALNKPSLTEEQAVELFGKNIKIVPKLYVDKSVLNYIFIKFDNFTMSANNSEFRDNTIEFDIVCHWDQWQLKDLALRPFKIAAEIDSMVNNKYLVGIGDWEFVGCKYISLSDEFAGYCLMYQSWHRDDDQKKMPNPADEARFLEDFKEYTKAEGKGKI